MHAVPPSDAGLAPVACFVYVCAAGHDECGSQEAILKATVCLHQLFSSFSLARKKASSNRGLPFNRVPE